MHSIKKLPALLVLISCILFFAGCGAQTDKKKYRSTDRYEFANPKIIELPSQLDEISGITYYPKDQSVFAIIDEDGILYKIPLLHPDQIKEWQFDKKRDYEDLVLKDSIFYVLVSNGDIEELRFEGDKIRIDKMEFPDASKKLNEFETLYYDQGTGKIIMMCKSCEDDKKKQVSSFFIDDTAKVMNFYSAFDVSPVFDKFGIPKDHIKPSAAAIEPVTKDLYVICSVNKLLLILDAQGTVKDVIPLNPKIYKQPEGIAFTPGGDLIISNESHEEGYGTLLLLKNKKPR